MSKHVAVILLSWNAKLYTEQCIQSIKNHASDNLYDIIVADNGSTDNSILHLKKKFSDLIFIDNKINLGFTEGNNRALDYASKKGYKYSLLLNNDTIITDDVIKKLYDYLENNKHVAAVQPAIFELHNRQKLWNGEMDFNPIFGITYSKSKLPIEAKAVKWITGCCFLIRNDVLKNTGMFNEKFFLYYEDVELSFRIRAKGYQLNILPNATIYHEAGTSGKLKNKSKEGYLNPIIHYYLTRNKIWFLKGYASKWFYPIILLSLIAQITPLICYFVIKGKKQKLSNLVKGVVDGLFTSSKKIYQK